MPRITPTATLRLAEELIRFGVDPARESAEAVALRELAEGVAVEPLSHMKAARWLGERGRKVSAKTLKRKLGTIESIREGRPFVRAGYGRGVKPAAVAPSVPMPPSRPEPPSPALPAGFRGLVEDDSDGGAPAEPQPRPKAKPKPKARKARGRQRPESGDLLPELLPREDPVNARGEVLFTVDELAAVCSAIYASAIDIAGAALSCGLNPFRLQRVLRDGMTALSGEKEGGEADVALAVLGHWAACSKRAGQAITVTASSGDVRAQKLLLERLDQHAPDWDKIGGDVHEEAKGFARQIRALIHGDVEDETPGMIKVGAG